jgi:hypothetical protein
MCIDRANLKPKSVKERKCSILQKRLKIPVWRSAQESIDNKKQNGRKIDRTPKEVKNVFDDNFYLGSAKTGCKLHENKTKRETAD